MRDQKRKFCGTLEQQGPGSAFCLPPGKLEDPHGKQLPTALRETGSPEPTWHLAHSSWSIAIDRNITEVSYLQLVMDKLDTELDHGPIAIHFLRILSLHSWIRHFTLNIHMFLLSSQPPWILEQWGKNCHPGTGVPIFLNHTWDKMSYQKKIAILMTLITVMTGSGFSNLLPQLQQI